MAYPTVLPRPVRDSYAVELQTKQQRTAMDAGNTRVRRKVLSKPHIITLSWHVNTYQRAMFDAWLKYEAMFGQNWVTIPNPYGDGEIEAQFVTGNPDIAADGASNWVISASMRLRGRKFVVPAKGAMPTWPTTLPAFESGTYKIRKVDPSSASKVSALATPYERQRFKTINTEYDCSITNLTQAQRQYFWDFFDNTLAGGDGYFYAVFENGIDKLPTRVRISVDPTEAAQGALFTIAFSLETREARTMTRAQYIEELAPEYSDTNDYSDGYFAEDYVE